MKAGGNVLKYWKGHYDCLVVSHLSMIINMLIMIWIHSIANIKICAAIKVPIYDYAK